MNEIDKDIFLKEVIESSHFIFFIKNSGEINNALPDKGSGEKLGNDVKSVQDVLEKSERILKDSTVMEKLCPALSSAGDNLSTICSTLIGVLIPLIIAKQVDIQINSIIFGGLAVTIFTSSIKSVCSQYLK